MPIWKLKQENRDFIIEVLKELDIKPSKNTEDTFLMDYIELICNNGYISQPLQDILDNKLDGKPFKYITRTNFRNICKEFYGLKWEKEVKYKICY